MGERVYGAVIGRQPEVTYMTPSNPYPWYGVIVEGSEFTGQQLHALKVRGIDPDACEAVEVRREATTRELWWPSTRPPPVYAFRCPVVCRRADGMVDVIAPYGDVKRVQGDGWIKPPRGIAAHFARF